MGDFMALAWSPSDGRAADEAAEISACIAADPRWSPAWTGEGRRVWTTGVAPPRVREVAGVGIVIGDGFARGATTPYRGCEGPGRPTDPRRLARTFATEAWGAYAVVFAGDPAAVFRDPSGAMEVAAWRRGRVGLAVTDPGHIAPGLLPGTVRLDWRTIAAWVADTTSATSRPGLAGVVVVPPGGVTTLCPDGPESQVVWSPVDAARTTDDVDAEARLVAAVDLAVSGLTQSRARILGELSGGLDSAIVAGSLARQGLADRAVGWLNHFADRPEGDERRYVAAICEHLGLQPTYLARAPLPLTEDHFRAMSTTLRPAFTAIDPIYDLACAGHLEGLSADGLLTGQGGDVVFFQFPTALVAVDAMRARGLRALTGPFVRDIARMSHTSAWSVLRLAALDRMGRSAPAATPRVALQGRCAVPAGPAPWLAGADELPPAKRRQVTALASAQLVFGPSRRRAAAGLVQPLMAQPVLETCLSFSTPLLTRGGRDRALARQAFADRLPPALATRRSKGDMTALNGRMVLASLDWLKGHLLDGCLCEAGLLDRRRVELALQPERLIWQGLGGPFLTAAMIESWVRYWQTRMPDAAGAQRDRLPRRTPD